MLAINSFAQRPASVLVNIQEDEASYTLANGIVTGRVAKRSGDLSSLKYNGLELLDAESSRQAAYWSHDVSRGQRTARITIDPKSNDGAGGEFL